MLHTSRSKTESQRGFTFVELVIIAPIVILSIGAFIAVVVGMTAEVLGSRASNVLTYNIQDALNRIEQDVKLSSTFLARTTDGIFDKTVSGATTTSTDQGLNGDTTPFYNVEPPGNDNGQVLILNALATTGNPLNSSSQVAYLANKPNACGSSQAQNTPLTYNIVYFVKDPDGEGPQPSSLWRRTILPPDYATTACNALGSSVPGVAAPWQQPSCPPQSNGGFPNAFCKTYDQRLVDGVGVDDFSLAYYASANSTTENTAASTNSDVAIRQASLNSSTTVAVSIGSKQKVANQTIEETSSIRATRLDTNASTVASSITVSAPSVPVVSASSVPTTGVKFSWPVSAGNGTITYTAQYQIDGGAWTTALTNSTSRTFTVDPGHDHTVNARVTATNSQGTSSYGTATLSTPLWATPVLQSAWTDYGSTYAPARYTKTSEGVVVLSGLIKRTGSAVGGEVLFQLPLGYRPNVRQIYTTITNANAASRVDVDPDGSVRFQFGDGGYLSLDGIKFIPSTTTSINFQSMTLSNNWVNYDNVPTHQVASYAKDTLGRTFTRGVIKNGSTTSATLIAALPSGYQSPSYLHLPTFSNTGFSFLSPSQTNSYYTAGAGLQYKAGGNSYYSIETMFYNDYTGFTSITTPTPTGWVWYSSTGIFSTPAYKKASDGIVTLKGLIMSGTTTSDTTIFTLPAGFRPSARLIFEVANNNAVGRVDVMPNGQVRIMTGGNVWLALDNISFIAEQ